jgi:hypothetical protein
MIKFRTYKSNLALALNAIFDMDNTCFSYGSIDGVYQEKDDVLEILMIINNKPHNGNFKKFMNFISNYCRQRNKKLAFVEIWNNSLRHKLLNEGYTLYPNNGLVKDNFNE